VSSEDRDAVFDALADEHRRAILDRLRQRNGLTLTQLCEKQQISRQAITKHLKILENANLVLAQRRGRVRLHFLNPVPINAIAMRWLKQFDAVPLDALLAVPAHRKED
jgi:DNA-binding transcriptional ArsR family regulator